MRKKGGQRKRQSAAKALASILNHYSAGFTLDTYTHTTPAMQQAATNKVGSFIAQAV